MVYLFFALLLFAYLFNTLSRNFSWKGLKVSRNLSHQLIQPGEVFQVQTIVENRKWLPVSFLQVQESLPKEMQSASASEDPLFVSNNSFTLSLWPFQRVERSAPYRTFQRGRYLFNDITLRTGDFLGLNTTEQQTSFLQELIVIPALVDLQSSTEGIGGLLGDISVKRRIIEDPIFTSGIREYTGFEPQKQIHWPSSLHHQRLMVRNFDHTSEQSILLAVNGECSIPFWKEIHKAEIEHSLSLARTLAEFFEEIHMNFSFCTNLQSVYFTPGISKKPSQGKAHLQEVFRILGSAGESVDRSFQDTFPDLAKQSFSCNTLVLIMPIILESYVPFLNVLAGQFQRLILFVCHPNSHLGLASKAEVFVSEVKP